MRSLKLNIKRNYYKVLLKLGIEKKPINQTNLGEICSIDKPATSRLVGEMEQEGFIERGAKDGNKKLNDTINKIDNIIFFIINLNLLAMQHLISNTQFHREKIILRLE